MKTILQKCLFIGMLILLLSSSCTTVLPAIPTSTVTPVPTPTSTPTPPYKMLSPEDMRSDLDEMFRQIEEVHPNPYGKRSKAEVDRDRQALYEELSQPMTIVDFYRNAAPLIASLKDDHTRVYLPTDTLDEVDQHEIFLPLDVELENGQALIVENYTGNPEIPLGGELLAIDNIPLSSIRQNAIFSDPVGPFFWKLWISNGSRPEYQITILPPNTSTPVSFRIPSLTVKEIESQLDAEEPQETVTYTTLSNEKIGLLTINGFRNVNESLKDAFAAIRQDDIQHLVIDVRANPGGGTESLDILMNYLTDQPYQRWYKGAFIRPTQVQNPYHGKVYLLIGPDTASAAVILATILQDYHLATLIGEETNESSTFCFSATLGEPLPRTKLKFRVSYKCTVRPSGVDDGHGVIPDIPVETTIKDQQARKDPVLDYTLELIRNGGQNP